MADQLTEKEIEEITEAFNLFAGEDEQIKTTDLGTIMRSVGDNPTYTELYDYIQEQDPEVTGFINFDSFQAIIIEYRHNKDSIESILEAFREFDKDQTGVITTSELKYVLKENMPEVSVEDFDKIIKETDHDQDGKIDFNEFVHVVMGE